LQFLEVAARLKLHRRQQCHSFSSNKIFMNALLEQFVLAGFTSPVHIGTTPYSFLLAMPLIAVVAIVYKATKMEKIELISFVRESFLLFGSIVIFMVLTAVGIFIFMKLTVG